MLAAIALLMFGMGAQPKSDPDGVRAALHVSSFTTQDIAPPRDWSPFTCAIQLGGRTYELRFSPHSIRGPGYRLLVDDGMQLREVGPPPETTYRGTIEGRPDAVIAGSVTNGKLTAMIRLGAERGQTWNIQPLPGAPESSTSHVISSDRDLIAGPWTCGVPDGPIATTPAEPTLPGRAFLTCQIACDADYEFFTLNGSSVPTTSSDISAVINGMAAVYQADANITFQLGTVVVRQAPTQPYTATNPNTLLDQFRTEWTSNQVGTQRDLAHLFTGKDMDGSTIGLAYLSVVCNSTFGYGESQSRFSSNFSYRVGVTSHEVGHNFSAGHCDASCSPCRIMCSGIGGCSGVVTSFGCSGPTIAAYSLTVPCLSPFNSGVAVPFFDAFTSTTLDYNRWPTPSNSGAVVATTAVNERSAPNSLDVANTASITTAGIDLTNTGGRRVYVTFWSQHRGVELSKTLAVQYRRPVQSDYQPLVTLTSDGVDQNNFALSEIVLPTDGQGANAMIRFIGQGNQADDHWYIDDLRVSLYCRPDLNLDGRLNIFDFVAYQSYLGTLDMMADWNGDTFINSLDFAAFFNSFAAGCTGY